MQVEILRVVFIALVSIVVVVTSDGAQWKSLQIVAIAPASFIPRIPQNAFDGLRYAMREMSVLVKVSDFEKNSFISYETIAKCTPHWTTTERSMFVGQFVSGRVDDLDLEDLQQGITLPFNDANFVVFLQEDITSCSNDVGLFAAAAPCEIVGDRRPTSGAVIVCPRNAGWPSFRAATDLFKHEFMHALGFGLINPDAEGRSPEARKFVWKLESKQQPITSYYMDFQDTALVYARTHLACKQLRGVEAEDADKTHLNEYIYGDELMTPVLSNSRNYFTKISASILEATKRGERPWYKTNATIVDVQSEEYWYGRSWGCAFAEGSCIDYINDVINQRKSTTFPFCTAKMLVNEFSREHFYKPHRRPSVVCFSNGTVWRTVHISCNAMDKVRGDVHPGDKLKASTLSEHFTLLRGTKLRSLFGSERSHRFCPFSQEVLFDRIERIPRNAIVGDCEKA